MNNNKSSGSAKTFRRILAVIMVLTMALSINFVNVTAANSFITHLGAANNTESDREGWYWDGNPTAPIWTAKYLVVEYKATGDNEGPLSQLRMFIRGNTAAEELGLSWRLFTTNVSPAQINIDTRSANTFIIDITTLAGYAEMIGGEINNRNQVQIGFMTNSGNGQSVLIPKLNVWLTDHELDLSTFDVLQDGVSWITEGKLDGFEVPEYPDMTLNGIEGPRADGAEGPGTNPNFAGGSGNATNGNRYHSSVDQSWMGGGASYVEFIGGNAWIKYPNRDIDEGIEKFEARIAVGEASNKTVELLIADPGAPITEALSLGTTTIERDEPAALGWGTFFSYANETEIAPHEPGIYDIYVRMVGGGINFDGVDLYLHNSFPMVDGETFETSWLANEEISPGNYDVAEDIIVLNNGGGFRGSFGRVPESGLPVGNTTSYDIDLYFNAARTPGSEGAYWSFVGPDVVAGTYDNNGEFGIASPAVDDHGVDMANTKQSLRPDGSINDIVWAPVMDADGEFHLSAPYRLNDMPITNGEFDFGILVNNLPEEARVYIAGFKAVVRGAAEDGGDVVFKWGDMNPPTAPADLDRILKIVAVGCSITAGDLGNNENGQYEVAGNNAYPQQLGRMLGNGFEMNNMGLPGACYLIGGEMPYWSWQSNNYRLSSGEYYQPDIVLMSMGGNDSHDGNWPRMGSTDAEREVNFKADLRTYLDYYLGLDSEPIVVLGQTVGTFFREGLEDRDRRIRLLCDWTADVAAEYDANRVLLIDEYTWSQQEFMQSEEMFNPRDRMHMTIEGYRQRALNFQNFMLENISPALSMRALPEKLVYNAGEELDLYGAKLRADFDGHIADFFIANGDNLHAGVTVKNFDPNLIGKQTVTVAYWGEETTFDVTVNGDVTVDGFSINGVEGTVSNEYSTIHITLPDDDLTALTPVFDLPAGAAVEADGAYDFTTPQYFLVTGPDGVKAYYKVTVSVFDPARVNEGGPITIFCIGDSITEGVGRSQGEAYPQRLERLLNAKYGANKFNVINGGMSGYGVQENTIFPEQDGPGSGYYGKPEQWQKVINAEPDIVIFSLGPNNCKETGPEPSWVDHETFHQAFRNLLDKTLELETHPLVIMSTSCRVKAGNFGLDPAILDSIIPIQRQVAAEYGLGVVDGYTLSESLWETGYSSDNIHFNDIGYEALAGWKFDYVTSLYDNADEAVTFDSLTANGAAGTETSTELTLTFSQAITGLTANDITVTGATKGALTGSGPVYKLAVSDITEDGAAVTVSVAAPAGFTITPNSLSTVVYKEAEINTTPVFTDGGGDVIDSLTAGTLNTAVSYKNETESAVSRLFIVALYTADDRLVLAETDAEPAIAAGAVADFNVSLSVPADSEGYYVNVFLWDGDSFVPVSEKVTFQ